MPYVCGVAERAADRSKPATIASATVICHILAQDTMTDRLLLDIHALSKTLENFANLFVQAATRACYFGWIEISKGHARWLGPKQDDKLLNAVPPRV